MIITLEDAKAHLNILDDHDDGLITAKIRAAEAWIEAFVTCSLDPDDAPDDVKEAARQLVGYLYADREGATTIPPGVWELITPYRTWGF